MFKHVVVTVVCTVATVVGVATVTGVNVTPARVNVEVKAPTFGR